MSKQEKRQQHQQQRRQGRPPHTTELKEKLSMVAGLHVIIYRDHHTLRYVIYTLRIHIEIIVKKIRVGI
jgi:hypothetical protein